MNNNDKEVAVPVWDKNKSREEEIADLVDYVERFQAASLKPKPGERDER
jgi:hypothetical protein|tara:strand:- start:80 stop:226 length:147 start_codon:yes stop_codon:yes gene_type:complete